MPFKPELVFGKDFKMIDNHFELSPEYMKANSWRFKKITATRLCAVLGKGGSLNTPFKAWCQMVNIYFEEMDKMRQKVGNVLEPKVRELLSNYLHVQYKSYDPKEIGFDIWKGKDDVFGGIPDGEPLVNGKVDYSTGLPLIEIKTSSVDAFLHKKEKGVFVLQTDEKGDPVVKTAGAKKLEWYKDGKFTLSEEYKYQIGLYMYLRNAPVGLLACVFVNTKDYAHPENVVVSFDNVGAATIKIKPESMKKDIDAAREWYYKYIKTGISPEMTEKDRIWLKEVELLKD